MLNTFGDDDEELDDGEDPGDSDDDMTLDEYQMEGKKEALAHRGYSQGGLIMKKRRIEIIPPRN